MKKREELPNNFMLKNIVLLHAFEKVPIFALYFNSTQFKGCHHSGGCSGRKNRVCAGNGRLIENR